MSSVSHEKNNEKPDIQKLVKLSGGSLNKKKFKMNEFTKLVNRVTSGAEKPLDDKEIAQLFSICDVNKDGILDHGELDAACQWLRTVSDPISCLIIVDVQNDFISGSLALKKCTAKQDGAVIVPVINRLLTKGKFNYVAYSYDWHPADHISFIENVMKRKFAPSSPIKDPKQAKVGDTVIFQTEEFGPVEQRLWPTHCIKESDGAKLHRDLHVVDNALHIYKGIQSNVESYTAFGNKQLHAETPLHEDLISRNVSEVYVTGLAADVCVGMTSLDALEFGYTVALIEDATRGVDVSGIEKMKKSIESKGGHMTVSDEVIKGSGITINHRIATLRRRLAKQSQLRSK